MSNTSRYNRSATSPFGTASANFLAKARSSSQTFNSSCRSRGTNLIFVLASMATSMSGTVRKALMHISVRIGAEWSSPFFKYRKDTVSSLELPGTTFINEYVSVFLSRTNLSPRVPSAAVASAFCIMHCTAFTPRSSKQKYSWPSLSFRVKMVSGARRRWRLARASSGGAAASASLSCSTWVDVDRFPQHRADAQCIAASMAWRLIKFEGV